MKYLSIIFVLLGLVVSAQDDQCIMLGDLRVADDMDARSMTMPIEWKEINAVVHIHYSDSFPHSYIEQWVVDDAMVHLNEEMFTSYIEFDHVATYYHDVDDYANAGDILGTTACIPGNYYHMGEYCDGIVISPATVCNIHVYPMFCNTTLGFAWLYHYSNNSADGIWVRSDVFGRVGPQLGTYYEGRDENKTLIHEAGHYCGLYHIFQGIDFCGEPESDCSAVNDRVCDTPPIKISWNCVNPICPPTLYGGMMNNHMDYYIDSCRMHFTDGQIERMHSVLPQYRPDVFNTGWECAGDLNNDAVVGIADLLIITSLWNTEYYGAADANGDGWVTVHDLMEVLNNFGTLCLGADLDPFYQEEQLPVIKTEGMHKR
jgi:hypothetical protein